jgi:AMP deaminase
MEEYSVASQVWKLSAVDMCEIARNSVLQSGLEYRFKRHFLGRHFQKPGAEGNDIRQTNVPSIRLQYRLEMLLEEMAMVRDAAAASKLRK